MLNFTQHNFIPSEHPKREEHITYQPKCHILINFLPYTMGAHLIFPKMKYVISRN